MTKAHATAHRALLLLHHMYATKDINPVLQSIALAGINGEEGVIQSWEKHLQETRDENLSSN